MKHLSYIQNTYDFVDKISKLVIHDGCLLKTLDVESMYTHIDHAKGLNAVSEALQFRDLLYDGIMQLHELSLALQWAGFGPLNMPTYKWLNLRRPYIKQF